MIKVTIENKGSASLSIKGRHGFHIGPHSTVTVELPDTPVTANMVQRVRREYPAMRVSIEKPGAQPPHRWQGRPRHHASRCQQRRPPALPRRPPGGPVRAAR